MSRHIRCDLCKEEILVGPGQGYGLFSFEVSREGCWVEGLPGRGGYNELCSDCRIHIASGIRDIIKDLKK